MYRNRNAYSHNVTTIVLIFCTLDKKLAKFSTNFFFRKTLRLMFCSKIALVLLNAIKKNIAVDDFVSVDVDITDGKYDRIIF